MDTRLNSPDWIRQRIWLIGGAALVLGLLTGCAAGSGTFDVADRAGFLTGIWHGWIAPVTLIVQFFDSDIRIYEPFNTGLAYDLGFYIAIIAGFGSIRLTRKRGKQANRGAESDSSEAPA